MRRFLSGILGFLIGSSLIVSAASTTQPFGANGIPVKGFKLAEPYGPPNEGQTKSRLEGGKALVLPSGSALLSDGVVLRIFSVTNALQLVVRADECFYNASNHVINSAGPIRMQTADGKFTIEGTGFSFWQQTNSTNSSLIISNNVHTVIESALLQSSATNQNQRLAPGQEGPLTIDSVSFSYDGASGQGVWRTKVQVFGTNLVVHSDVLTAQVPIAEHQVRDLLAERDVTVNYSGIYGTGGRLKYAPNTGLICLSDRATWSAEEREGRGDELIIDRTNQIFHVNGHAWLKLPGQTLGQSGFLSASDLSARKSQPSARSSVEIACDSYEIRTNWAVFQNQVTLDEHVGKNIRSSLTCRDDLTITFAGTNELQTLTANKDVVIGVKGDNPEEDKRFSGGRAFYTHTNTTLELTQDPKWQSGLRREGKGDLLRINTQLEEMLVSGNASMRLPANELASQLVPTPSNITTNRPPRTGTNQFAEIFCEQYILRTNNSVFRGGVYATHPEMNWSCEKLTVQVAAAGITNMIADEKVVFEMMTQNGPFHGTGDNAIYAFGVMNTVTNGMLPVNELKLSGTPAIVAMTDRIVQNPVVILDRAKDKLTLPGSEYRIQGMAKAIDTNIFMLPNRKRTK